MKSTNLKSLNETFGSEPESSAHPWSSFKNLQLQNRTRLMWKWWWDRKEKIKTCRFFYSVRFGPPQWSFKRGGAPIWPSFLRQRMNKSWKLLIQEEHDQVLEFTEDTSKHASYLASLWGLFQWSCDERLEESSSRAADPPDRDDSCLCLWKEFHL